MQLSTLVDLLEREVPGIGDDASTRSNLARLYAERGCHEDARREAKRALAAGAVASPASAELRRIVATPKRRAR